MRFSSGKYYSTALKRKVIQELFAMFEEAIDYGMFDLNLKRNGANYPFSVLLVAIWRIMCVL